MLSDSPSQSVSVSVSLSLSLCLCLTLCLCVSLPAPPLAVSIYSFNGYGLDWNPTVQQDLWLHSQLDKPRAPESPWFVKLAVYLQIALLGQGNIEEGTLRNGSLTQNREQRAQGKRQP